MARMRALILAAGEDRPRRLLKQLAQHAELIVAADGGSRLARRARLRVDAFVGDGDSLTRAERDWLERQPLPVDWRPVAKDETDLELALDLALEQGAEVVEVFGGWGARADHTLSNVALLERAARAGARAWLWAGLERLAVLLPGQHVLVDAYPGQRVSLIPQSERVEGITTQGLRFALAGEPLKRAASRGVSNQVTGTPAALAFESGALVLVQAFGKDRLG